MKRRGGPRGLLRRLPPRLGPRRIPHPDGASLTAPGWSLYLARLNGEPAGAAILYVVGEDGYLADGAVDPAFRRHRVHRALLDRRCADAQAAGASRIFSGCDFLSASYRNQLRKGLLLLYTEAIWTSGLGNLSPFERRGKGRVRGRHFGDKDLRRLAR